MQEPVEVEQEQQQADREAAARQAHADVRDGVRPDPADDGDGEHERADQLGQHELEPPIAIPHAHVAGREDARRLLHAEDGHGDHEAGQRDGGSDRGRHDGRGGLRRVLQHGEVAARVEPVDELGEDEPTQAGDQRHQPQAVLDVLTDAEADDSSSWLSSHRRHDIGAVRASGSRRRDGRHRMSSDVHTMEPRQGRRAHRTARAMRGTSLPQSVDGLTVSRSPGNGSSRPISMARSTASPRLDTPSLP